MKTKKERDQIRKSISIDTSKGQSNHNKQDKTYNRARRNSDSLSGSGEELMGISSGDDDDPVKLKKKSKKALNFKTEKEYTKASKTEVEARGLNPNEILPADEDIQRMLGIRTIDTYYSTESQSIKIGTKVLKEFGDYGTYEGAVTSLPSSKNNYYYVTYDDGDGEDLYLSELQPLVDAYTQKYKINTSIPRTAHNKDLETGNETKRNPVLSLTRIQKTDRERDRTQLTRHVQRKKKDLERSEKSPLERSKRKNGKRR